MVRAMEMSVHVVTWKRHGKSYSLDFDDADHAARCGILLAEQGRQEVFVSEADVEVDEVAMAAAHDRIKRNLRLEDTTRFLTA